jgi:solute carrier family 8 (sodium/calcium exchanger)
MISEKTFFRHQESYLHTAISNVWKKQQNDMIQLLQAYNKPLSLGGDARCDSPGYSAKYGSYTLMELEYNAILHVELVQVI